MKHVASENWATENSLEDSRMCYYQVLSILSRSFDIKFDNQLINWNDVIKMV